MRVVLPWSTCDDGDVAKLQGRAGSSKGWERRAGAALFVREGDGNTTVRHMGASDCAAQYIERREKRKPVCGRWLLRSLAENSMSAVRSTEKGFEVIRLRAAVARCRHCNAIHRFGHALLTPDAYGVGEQLPSARV